MFRTKAKVMGLLMSLVLVLSTAVVYADNGHWGRMSLTDDQQKQLNDIWHKQRETMKTAFEQIKTDKEALTNELLQTAPDVNKINDLKSKLEALGAQMLDNRINSDLEVKKILTAQQFAKYLEFQKHGFKRNCRHHNRHHHGY